MIKAVMILCMAALFFCTNASAERKYNSQKSRNKSGTVRGDGLPINGPDGVEGGEFEALPIFSEHEIDLYRVYEAEHRCYQRYADKYLSGPMFPGMKKEQLESSSSSNIIASDGSNYRIEVSSSETLKYTPWFYGPSVSHLEMELQHGYFSHFSNNNYFSIYINYDTSYAAEGYDGRRVRLNYRRNGQETDLFSRLNFKLPNFRFEIEDIDNDYDDFGNMNRGRKVVKNLTLYPGTDVSGCDLYVMDRRPEDHELPAIVNDGKDMFSYQLKDDKVDVKKMESFVLEDSFLADFPFKENTVFNASRQACDYISSKGGHFNNRAYQFVNRMTGKPALALKVNFKKIFNCLKLAITNNEITN